MRSRDQENYPPGYRAFWRPTTPFNRVVESFIKRFPVRGFSEFDLQYWSHRSMVAFHSLSYDPPALSKAGEIESWSLAQGPAPKNVWFTEVVSSPDGSRVLVLIYRDSVVGRLPAKWMRRVAGQLGVDHVVGHLLPFFEGREDCGEEVSCNLQYYAARSRWGRWSPLAASIKYFYVLHKGLSLSVFARPARYR